MSAPTKEEMLDMLEAFHCQWQGADTEPEKWDPEGVRFRDAIRSLIEKMGEWQFHAMAILCSEFPEYDGTDVIDFMREIRDFDFGEEGK